MRRLEPLFARRWTKANSSLRNAQFSIENETEYACFTVARGRLSVGGPRRGTHVAIPRRWLSGLITGYYGVCDIEHREGVRIPSSVVPALNILFPAGCPLTYRGDNY
jgi:hypothetical protein